MGKVQVCGKCHSQTVGLKRPFSYIQTCVATILYMKSHELESAV